MTYLPNIYREFQQQFPEIAKAYDDLALKCHGWGPLNEKTRRLIKLPGNWPCILKIVRKRHWIFIIIFNSDGECTRIKGNKGEH